MKFFRTTFWLFLVRLQSLFGQESLHGSEKLLHIDPLNLEELYQTLFTSETKPTYNAFTLGIEGMMKIIDEGKVSNDSILTIIDYTKPSSERRLWVVDVKNEKIMHNALVAHGKNSGLIVPSQFSNTPKSNMSSPGFFVTGETYIGKHGYSLRIDGVEPGINDKARVRAIVIHSAEYATMDFVKQNGRLGRSFGCPALPPSKSKQIIDTIKDKSCLFIYTNDKQYSTRSRIVKEQLRI